MEFKEKRWIRDTKIARKVYEILGEREGWVEVEIPAKVNPMDEHIIHMREHKKLLSDENIRKDTSYASAILSHIMDHEDEILSQVRNLPTLSSGKPSCLLDIAKVGKEESEERKKLCICDRCKK